MTSIYAAIDECKSHLQTVEHLLLCAKEVSTENKSVEQIDALDEAWQQCKTLASSIDAIEDSLQ